MRLGFIYTAREMLGSKNVTMQNCHLTSRDTVQKIINLLQGTGIDVITIEDEFSAYEIITKNSFDLAFPICCSSNGEGKQVWIQSVLELFGIPFVGSSARSILLSSDKYQSSLLAFNYGINSIQSKIIIESDGKENITTSTFQFPCVIKPNFESNSRGVCLVNCKDELLDKAKIIWNEYKQKIICQPYIPGKEVTVSLVEENNTPQIIGLAETVNTYGQPYMIYSYADKHLSKAKKQYPIIPKDSYLYICESAISLFKAFDLHDYARIDFRLDKESIPYLLEVTPTPDLPLSASFFMGAKLFGVTPQTTLTKIINSARIRYNI